MKYKLVIFDFDGTLVDSYPWFSSSINTAARLFRFRELNAQEGDVLRNMDTRSILKFLNVPWWKLPLIANYMRRKMGRELAGIKLFTGIEELIQELHSRGVQLVIVSSNSQVNVKRIIPEDIANYIYLFECGSSLLGKKEKFQKVLDRLKVPPARVLCIGDESRDIEAAQSIGAHSGAVSWGYAKEKILRESNPTYFFNHPNEIIHLFQ